MNFQINQSATNPESIFTIYQNRVIFWLGLDPWSLLLLVAGLEKCVLVNFLYKNKINKNLFFLDCLYYQNIKGFSKSLKFLMIIDNSTIMNIWFNTNSSSYIIIEFIRLIGLTKPMGFYKEMSSLWGEFIMRRVQWATPSFPVV